jgi:hypothetical protein
MIESQGIVPVLAAKPIVHATLQTLLTGQEPLLEVLETLWQPVRFGRRYPPELFAFALFPFDMALFRHCQAQHDQVLDRVLQVALESVNAIENDYGHEPVTNDEWTECCNRRFREYAESISLISEPEASGDTLLSMGGQISRNLSGRDEVDPRIAIRLVEHLLKVRGYAESDMQAVIASAKIRS